ncbi:MAG: discoidin domain-containing protein [Planctomycetota bacterium]
MFNSVQRGIVGATLLFGLAIYPVSAAADSVDLSGTWEVCLDPDRAYAPNSTADAQPAFQPVRLPGALRDSGLGDPVGPATRWIGLVREQVWNDPHYAPFLKGDPFKVPFWLQPERHYVGQAWYRRAVEVPESWRGRRIVLFLERPHWRTTAWVDGQAAGEGESLSTPHVFDLTKHLTPGVHTLTIGVDNGLDPIDVGLNSHSVSDHTQTAWHGVVGRIELRAEPAVAVESLQVYPAEDGRSARVQVCFVNVTDGPRDDVLKLRATQAGKLLGEKSFPVTIRPGGTTIDQTLSFNREAERWDEFQPALCELEAALQSDEQGAACRRVTFGVRHVGTKGGQIVLNGRPIFLRGTLECCIFPLTGYPPCDVESWKRIIQVCKAHGLNHIRFHSWCPPEAAFVAADELGFYYQVECSTWPNASTSLGRGEPIDKWLYREGERILAAYGNHPSFLLLAAGNEPGGPERGGQYLGPWVEHFKAADDRRLVTSGSGWPSIPQNDYHVTPAPRIQQWGQALGSRINTSPPETTTDYRGIIEGFDAPVVSHEIGQWCVYPNFDEMPKYTGALRPKNFEIFRDLLEQAQMPDQAHDFLMASGKLQALCYKEEIESALRTPGFGGFQLLDLHDFPGQGTALVGVLDPFWDSKPYITPAEFRRFCGPTVPLARMAKRAWKNDETFVADVEVSHFGPKLLPAATTRWSLTRDGEEVAAGTLAAQDVSTGGLTKLGRIEWPLARFAPPAKLTLTVTVADAGTECANSWDVWVYPREIDTAPTGDLMVAHELNDVAVARLKQGGKVLLLANPRATRSDVKIGFSSIFWNTAWTGGQPPHTLGVLCDPKHPALAAFPTEYHSNWQWWELISRSGPMELNDLPPELRPIVQIVPDWFHPQRLGLIFEARVEGGKLLVCSIDLEDDLEQRPAARQMRRSLLDYAAGGSFDPAHTLTVDQVRGLFREISMLEKLGATAAADSAQRGHEAALAIDGDPQTFWHTAWGQQSKSPPHWLVVDLKKPLELGGLRYTPRRDMTNGRIGEFEVYVSSDGKAWTKAADGKWNEDASPKVVEFDHPASARFVKLVAVSEVKGRAWTSVAEIDVMVAGGK